MHLAKLSLFPSVDEDKLKSSLQDLPVINRTQL